jgi:hypothetical protein
VTPPEVWPPLAAWIRAVRDECSGVLEERRGILGTGAREFRRNPGGTVGPGSLQTIYLGFDTCERGTRLAN